MANCRVYRRPVGDSLGKLHLIKLLEESHIYRAPSGRPIRFLAAAELKKLWEGAHANEAETVIS